MATSPSLHVEEHGTQHTETIIFLHGGGVSGWMWHPQIDEFARDYHCLVPDLPAHGQSLSVQPFTMATAARRITEIIAARAHGGKAHLVGLSLGAQVGVEVLATAPESLHSAFISSALLHPLPASWLYTKTVLRWTFLLSAAPFKHSAWYARLNMRSAVGIPEAYFPQFFEDFQRATADTFTQTLVANLRYRLPNNLKRAALPVLVVVGKKEYQVMQKSARDLVAALPDARGVLVDVGRKLNENHNWSLNAPDLFNQMLRAWLTHSALPAEVHTLT
jgi:pimeloyl-ACP methyl ester carboxylesterase